jgi:hypothetical protein
LNVSTLAAQYSLQSSYTRAWVGSRAVYFVSYFYDIGLHKTNVGSI